MEVSGVPYSPFSCTQIQVPLEPLVRLLDDVSSEVSGIYKFLLRIKHQFLFGQEKGLSKSPKHIKESLKLNFEEKNLSYDSLSTTKIKVIFYHFTINFKFFSPVEHFPPSLGHWLL